MKPPKIFGPIIYFFGYPVFRLLIKNTNRAYVLVRTNNSILLTKNWLGFQRKWRLPGGGIKGQENPAVAAARELAEEVGIAINISDLKLITKLPIDSDFRYKYWLYELNIAKPLKLNIDEREILQAKYINIKQLNKLTLSEEANNALRLTKLPKF